MQMFGAHSGLWIAQAQIILDCYKRLLGQQLIERTGIPEEDANLLYIAPFAALSHGTEADPILNYGNAKVLELWELTPAELLQMPSRHTAEPANREARAKFLEETKRKGFVTGYSGVRISKSGRRFKIENATVWNLTGEQGEALGQAAVFKDWTRLD